MYRNLKGVSTFTGFVNRNGDIYWIGKRENQNRKIGTTQDDINFFMTQMKQYD